MYTHVPIVDIEPLQLPILREHKLNYDTINNTGYLFEDALITYSSSLVHLLI